MTGEAVVYSQGCLPQCHGPGWPETLLAGTNPASQSPMSTLGHVTILRETTKTRPILGAQHSSLCITVTPQAPPHPLPTVAV